MIVTVILLVSLLCAAEEAVNENWTKESLLLLLLFVTQTDVCKFMAIIDCWNNYICHRIPCHLSIWIYYFLFRRLLFLSMYLFQWCHAMLESRNILSWDEWTNGWRMWKHLVLCVRSLHHCVRFNSNSASFIIFKCVWRHPNGVAKLVKAGNANDPYVWVKTNVCLIYWITQPNSNGMNWFMFHIRSFCVTGWQASRPCVRIMKVLSSIIYMRSKIESCLMRRRYRCM